MVLKISIRPFTEEDYDSVIKLWDKVFPGALHHNNPARDLRTRREVPPELFLVATQEEGIIGTVMAGYDGQQGWVYYLGVDPAFRRQGIGTSLMKRVEEELGKLGCPKLNIMVRAHNKEVVEFYEKLGYEQAELLNLGKML